MRAGWVASGAPRGVSTHPGVPEATVLRPQPLILAALVGLLVALASVGAAASVDEPVADGLHLTPSVAWTRGDHRVDLSLTSRYRWEIWNARAPSTDNLHGFRTRFGLRYGWRDRIDLLVEGQHTAVLDLGPGSSGIGGGYYSTSGGASDPSAVNVRQLRLSIRPTEDSRVSIGRQPLEMGTWVEYAGSDWKTIKSKRMSQRLVGIVDWTNGSRTYDGLLGSVAFGGHHLTAFAARPTRGVVDIEGLFEALEDVYVGGAEWTAPPGTLNEHLDWTAFFVGYGDTRRNFAIDDDVAIYTLGGSVLGIFDVGPGRLDAMLWGAFQAGRFREGAGRPTLDHLAGALLAEVGYRLTDVHGEPWLRTGVNFGSGDGDPLDGTHHTFFNVLPTNHGYYGLVDQLAMQNLVDWFAQLEWRPIEKLGVSFFAHRFWLADRNDFKYAGTGAFNPYQLAYASSPSRGSDDLGWETDLVLTYALHRSLTLMAGYGQLFGGGVFTGDPNGQDVQWGFAQLQLSY